jgi:type IV secretory pathway VirB4 component
MLSVLPQNCLIHRQDYFLSKNYSSSNLILDTNNFFENSLLTHFNNRSYREQISYIYITFLDTLGFKRKLSNVNFFKKISSPDAYIKKIESLKILSSKAIATLSQELHARELSKEELVILIDSHFNGFEENIVSSPFFKPEFKIGRKHFSIFGLDEDINQKDGDIDVAVINEEFSSEISKLYNSYMAKFGYAYDSDHVINSFIFYDHQEGVKAELQTNQSKLKGLTGIKRTNNIASNRLDKFLNMVETDNSKIVRASFNITIFDENLEKLKEKEKNLQTVFGRAGIVPTEFNYLDYPYIFLSNTPGCGGHLPIEYTFITIADIALIYTLFESVNTDVEEKRGYLYTNRNNNTPFRLDTFFKPYEAKLIDNRNYIVVAPSGGGKSFDSKSKAFQQYKMGFDQIVINIGGDDKMVKLINANSNDAAYISFEPGVTLPINPFYVENYLSNDKIEFLIPFIWLLWGGSDEINSDKESILNKILVSYYDIDLSKTNDKGAFKINNPDREFSLSSFYYYLKGNKDEILDFFHKDKAIFNLDSLLINLEKFAEGNYANLFAKGKPALFEKKKYVEFELDNIKDHPFLFTIFSMLISDITFNTMWSTEGYKDFFIDEAWKILDKANSGMALLLKYLYKTIRKFDGGVGIAIQQITDLSNDTVIENAILGNCAIKHIYNHKNVLDQVHLLSQKLSLTKTDVAQLLSIRNKQKSLFPGDKIKYSEKLLMMGSEYSNILRIETSPELAVIFDSEKSRLKKFNDLLIANNQDIEKTVINYLNTTK